MKWLNDFSNEKKFSPFSFGSTVQLSVLGRDRAKNRICSGGWLDLCKLKQRMTTNLKRYGWLHLHGIQKGCVVSQDTIRQSIYQVETLDDSIMQRHTRRFLIKVVLLRKQINTGTSNQMAKVQFRDRQTQQSRYEEMIKKQGTHEE